MIGASAKNRSDFCQNSSRKPIDVGMFLLLVQLIIPHEGFGGPAQLRRRRPCQRRQRGRGARYDDDTSPFQVKQREHRQHDRHRDQRRPRHDDEHHVDDEAQRDRDQQRRQPDSLRAQRSDDGIGERHGAQREFLALVDIVLDRNAVFGSPDLSASLGSNATIQDIAINSAAGNQKGDKHLARRAPSVRNDRTAPAASAVLRSGRPHRAARPMARPTRAFRRRASANSAIGRAQIGRFSDCRKSLDVEERRHRDQQCGREDRRPATSTRAAKARSGWRKYPPSSPRRPDPATAATTAPRQLSATALTPCLRARDRPATSC